MLKEERNHLGWHTKQTGEASWKEDTKNFHCIAGKLHSSKMYSDVELYPKEYHHSGYSDA